MVENDTKMTSKGDDVEEAGNSNQPTSNNNATNQPGM